jgi:antitoxin VapB
MTREDRSTILFPPNERLPELRGKQNNLQQFMEDRGLDGLLVSRHENIAWATAGIVDLRVGLARETGVGSLLFTRDGGRYYLTSTNEAPRLHDEEFSGLDFQPVSYPWYRNDARKAIDRLVPSGKLASDSLLYDLPLVSLQSLRLVLTAGEIARYRWLGGACAESVMSALRHLAPGKSEAVLQADVAGRLLARGISPSVLLIATDDRIRRYRHAVPRDGSLQNFGMLNVCARRWGLVVSITRFVYFGQMPKELSDKFVAVAMLNARLLHATREGATADDLFYIAQRAYAELGYAGEEQMHHQGGATGYVEREWVARPGGTERVHNNQAFAWNPSLQGAKVEDTVIVHGDQAETLTSTPEIPTTQIEYQGRFYTSAGVLPR